MLTRQGVECSKVNVVETETFAKNRTIRVPRRRSRLNSVGRYCICCRRVTSPGTPTHPARIAKITLTVPPSRNAVRFSLLRNCTYTPGTHHHLASRVTERSFAHAHTVFSSIILSFRILSCSQRARESHYIRASGRV